MSGPLTSSDDVLKRLRAVLEPHGVFLRGAVNFVSGDKAPILSDGQAAASIVLLGNIGRSIWPSFERWRGVRANKDARNPLDTWSKAVIGPVALEFGATAYFPSDPPWQPFQQWAMRADDLRQSPLGILIHPEYGLWHGYRGALGFGHFLPAALPVRHAHPCDTCSDKPCLSGCPVDAVLTSGFQIAPCRTHLKTAEGKTNCMIAGCLARNLCPVGTEYRYQPEQLRFHMAALNL
jgi:hypothetical protein